MTGAGGTTAQRIRAAATAPRVVLAAVLAAALMALPAGIPAAAAGPAAPAVPWPSGPSGDEDAGDGAADTGSGENSAAGIAGNPGGNPAGNPGEDPAPCAAPTGPYQRKLEDHLGLDVDGSQSPEDCRAIRAFQREHGLSPADGYAGIPTYRTLLVVQARENPNAGGRCPAGPYKVACVDLTRQLMWVQEGEDGTVTFGPVPVRTGREDLETRGGWHRVYLRKKDHVSTLYEDAPMPYSQFFDGGQAFHGTYDNLFESGSAGCVNMYLTDAERLWEELALGDRVFVFGRKAGTNPRSIPRETGAPGFSGEKSVDEQGRSLLSDAELIAEGMGPGGVPLG